MTEDAREPGLTPRQSPRGSDIVRARLPVLVLATLLVLAGCVTPVGPLGETPATGAPERTAAAGPGTTGAGQSTAATGTGAGEPGSGSAAGPTPTTGAANPWGRETLTVSVVDTVGSWRSVTGHVADALAYWAAHQHLAGYRVAFALRPDAREPDVVVRYVEDVATCGAVSGERGAGFAPRISAATPPDPPEYICVRTGYTAGSTRRIVRHEFGHLLGIAHGEPPTDLMRPDYPLVEVPRPDPDVLATRFDGGPLSVFVDRSTVYGRRDLVARQQVDRAVEYYERGPSSLPAGPANVTVVQERAAADVVLTFPRQSPCRRTRPGSCADIATGSEGDPQLVVAITTTHEDRFGWHAAFWLAIALGVDRHRDLPAPLRNASLEERGGAWWDPGS